MKNPFKLLSTREIYQNHWIKVREDKVIRPGGKEGIFGIVEMMNGATVLAMNDNQEVYLVKEYKYGIDSESIELISGGPDAGEEPIDLAKRELKEEAGLEAREWIYLGQYHPLTSILKSESHLFLALGAKMATKPNPGEGEIIETVKVPLAKAVEMAMNAEIKHIPSCFLILKAEKYLKDR